MRVLIFDHTDSGKKLVTALQTAAKYTPFPLFCDVVKRAPDNAQFVSPPLNGNYHVDPVWFRDTFSVNAKGYDFCVAYFSNKQWSKLQKKNRSKAESINQNYGVSEIALSGSLTKRSSKALAPKVNENEFVVRLLHEMCHGMFDHKLKVKDVTHYWHYEQKNLLEAIKLWVVTNREKLYQTALLALNTDASPNDVAPDELGCAETVNAIHKKAFWKEIGGGLSTYQMYKALLNHPSFIKVDTPLRGDIVISPTGYGNGGLTNGHVGILGDGFIMSNDSATGLFKPNYTLDSWKKRYVVQGGYPMDFFRRT